MSLLSDLFRTRVLPAFVAALGASFIAAGLLSYVSGSGEETGQRPTLRPAATLTAGGSEPSAASRPTPAASVSGPTATTPPAGGSPKLSAAPSPSASASLGATPKPTKVAVASPTPAAGTGGRRVATRVVIPALGIDLPVIKPPGGANTYPVCNVAMYIQSLSQPGEKGATYLYAHARTGMFLPILEASRVNNGRAMVGMLVQVYTSDNLQFLYEIYQVRRHQLTLTDAIAAKSETLWLQTSEGPRGTPGKTQVIARPISSGPADPDEAHPEANPVVCG